MNTKQKFQEAMKLFDNKDYKACKKACDKILDKNPSNTEGLALKGLTLYYLKEKEEGKKLINQAIKTNFKSSIAWHFYAIFHREENNNPQALKCYIQAYKNDPTNFNVIRDISYIQLFLRQLNSFETYSKIAVDVKPNIPANWITYSLANALIKNYDLAERILELAENTMKDTLKKNEIHEMRIFGATLREMNGNYEDALKYLLESKEYIIDTPIYYEKIIKNAFLSKKYETGIEYCYKFFENNPENANILVHLLNMKLNSINSEKDALFKNYNDILSIQEDNKNLKEISEIINDLIQKYPKSKMLARVDLAVSMGDEFKDKFEKYLIKNINQTLPSCYINVKFIYKNQTFKINIIQNFLNQIEKSINEKKEITPELKSQIHFAWFYFYCSLHYCALNKNEEALININKATDISPTVVEFYMAKAKILRRCGMTEESALFLEKAKKLDCGDRYLSAKHAKILTRRGEIEKGVTVMKEFVREPLDEDNMEYYQCFWHQIECANAFLQKGKLIHAYVLLKYMLKHFHSMYEDQSDFYNFSLRKFMVNDLYRTLLHLDKIYNNKNVFETLSKLDLLYNYVKYLKEVKKIEDSYFAEEKKEAEEFGFKKMKFESVDGALKDIEEEFVKVLKNVQSITQNEMIHFYCVKYFLIKDKFLMALKSMKYLLKNKKTSFACCASLKLFKAYAEKHPEKISHENFKGKVEDILKENITSWEEKDLLKKIEYTIYEKGEYNKENLQSENIKAFFNQTKEELRGTKNVKINNFYSWVRLYFTDQNEFDKIKEELRNKIKVEASEEEIKKDCDFYEIWQGEQGAKKEDKK
ncbi:MAG: hypothetical protein MJ252_19390 [archaeon]|nr:hypothetical protein [archaeon]